MNKLVLLFMMSMITFGLSAQNTSDQSGIFTFESEVINYGTINQNSDGKRVFIFTNTGNSPIIITKVKGSCGCTVATKPNQPIMPGEKAEIGVSYATNRLGAFSKTIVISSNASESSKVLRIKGTVLKNDTANLEKQKSVVSN
jgi:hypothetical protein